MKEFSKGGDDVIITPSNKVEDGSNTKINKKFLVMLANFIGFSG
jgi:hypothetical protein